MARSWTGSRRSAKSSTPRARRRTEEEVARAPRQREALARKHGAAEDATRGSDREGRHEDPRPRSRVRLPGDRRDRTERLGREGLQARDREPLREALREAGLHGRRSATRLNGGESKSGGGSRR